MGAAKGQRQRNDTLVMQMLGEKVRLLRESGSGEARTSTAEAVVEAPRGNHRSLRWALGLTQNGTGDREEERRPCSQSVVGV